MVKYNIVLSENKNYIIATYTNLNSAKKFLKTMIKNNNIIRKKYKLNKLPKYEIIKEEIC